MRSWIRNRGQSTNLNKATDTTLTFDGCGNRTALNGIPQAYNNMNQPTGGTFSYNNEGCLLTYNGWTYTYDAQNRLTNVANGQTPVAQFYYDGKNRQIARAINGLVTFSVWDDWELIEEYGTGNVRTAAYLQGAHGPIKSLMTPNIYFYQDELGSTSHIADATGHLLEYYKYNLYGSPTYWSPTNPTTPLLSSAYNIQDLFSGERYVPELGLYDLRNRFMSPDLGRFLQPDPIGFKGDASNLYRYCGNDWANRTDPTGLDDSVKSENPLLIGTGAKITPPDSGDRLKAASDLDRHCEFYQRAIQAEHAEPSSGAGKEQITATGQITGPPLAGKAPAGDVNGNEAPDGLVKVGQIDKGYYTFYLLQLTRHGIYLTDKYSYVEEQVSQPTTTGNISSNLIASKGFVNTTKGVALDRVGALQLPGPKTTGTITAHQQYVGVVYKGFQYPLHVKFDQVTTITNGAVTTNLIPLGH